MNRKLSLISPELGELLVKQIAHELKNYNLYRSYASFFNIEGLVDLQEYYHKRAEEELHHHDWIVEYLTEGDYKFTYPAVEKNTEVFTEYVHPFIQTIDREILTTQMIYSIYELAESQKDYMTCVWLYKYLLNEQLEEENISRAARVIIEETGDIFNKAKAILGLLK